jgi:hypothetical protein
MKSKALAKYVKLHKSLVAEQAELAARLAVINQALGGHAPVARKGRRAKRGMSAAGRARIAAAQRARWAKIKAAKK